MKNIQICWGCKKPVSVEAKYFYHDSHRKNGFQSRCKKCFNVVSEERKKRVKGWLTLKGRYYRIKSGAKTRGIYFNLTLEDIRPLWQENCIYCNARIETLGIDRINFKKGYINGNITSCCKTCNTLKGQLEWRISKAPKKMIAVLLFLK